MLVAVLSPPDARPDEASVLGRLLQAGLARYHVRKPGWSSGRLEAWLAALPQEWRPRLVLHGDPALAVRLGLGGIHWRDDAGAPADPAADGWPGGAILSRSCHSLEALSSAFGAYDSLFFGPLFPSVSKPGHGPAADLCLEDVARVLRAPGRRTQVLALGGITEQRLAACRELGFDGAAVLGAVWGDPDPAAAFSRILAAAGPLKAGGLHAA